MGDTRLEVPDEVTDIICENCGRNMVIKVGRYGKFLACPGYPECKIPKKSSRKHPVCVRCAVERSTLKNPKRAKPTTAVNTIRSVRL